MQRIAFQLQVRPGMADAYDQVHRHVWPELMNELSRFGVRDYSIFRRNEQLFLYMRVPDFQQLVVQLAESDVNRRWQERMAPFFEPATDLGPQDTFATMAEVFYMPGDSTSQ